MGREFGRLSTSVGNRVQFSISPFEQRVFPMASLLSPIPNTIRRVSRSFLLVTIPMYSAYAVKNWCSRENEKFNRKHPEDYENDQ